eukprot:CAMPEP_0180486582 /NCGR_PEP_ID=MMETSP1036_2-20121128/37068_1 /TAXON_ID=632150 /ORGANISM="Azadinium spinosum, Strain 3D9" /LENGTH=146 /DNA_ID=CAMNT_0022494537 /DNA_START=481 /DNA_END=918 /DNA_ORIENTATION=-
MSLRPSGAATMKGCSAVMSSSEIQGGLNHVAIPTTVAMQHHNQADLPCSVDAFGNLNLTLSSLLPMLPEGSVKGTLITASAKDTPPSEFLARRLCSLPPRTALDPPTCNKSASSTSHVSSLQVVAGSEAAHTCTTKHRMKVVDGEK